MSEKIPNNVITKKKKPPNKRKEGGASASLATKSEPKIGKAAPASLSEKK